MEQLCRKIRMPEEVTRLLVQLDGSMAQYPCQELLMEESTWNAGLAQLKQTLGEDPQGFRGLCCMLRCARKARSEYARLGIPEEIYYDTMAAFSRFVREHMESYGCYGFDRGFWVPRQISCRLFRIGQLEYELTGLNGQSIISLHIPTDVDLRPEILLPSLKAGLRELHRLFPDTAGMPVYCHSWLLSPLLKTFLPEQSNILRFQSLFDLQPDQKPGTGVLLWVFKNPRLPVEEYPENTSLHRKLKAFFRQGGQFMDGAGWLKAGIRDGQ